MFYRDHKKRKSSNAEIKVWSCIVDYDPEEGMWTMQLQRGILSDVCETAKMKIAAEGSEPAV